MITFIGIAILAILVVGLGVMAWNNGARKRAGQSQVRAQNTTATEPKVGRATGPD